MKQCHLVQGGQIQHYKMHKSRRQGALQIIRNGYEKSKDKHKVIHQDKHKVILVHQALKEEMLDKIKPRLEIAKTRLEIDKHLLHHLRKTKDLHRAHWATCSKIL